MTNTHDTNNPCLYHINRMRSRSLSLATRNSQASWAVGQELNRQPSNEVQQVVIQEGMPLQIEWVPIEWGWFSRETEQMPCLVPFQVSFRLGWFKETPTGAPYDLLQRQPLGPALGLPKSKNHFFGPIFRQLPCETSNWWTSKFGGDERVYNNFTAGSLKKAQNHTGMRQNMDLEPPKGVDFLWASFSRPT